MPFPLPPPLPPDPGPGRGPPPEGAPARRVGWPAALLPPLPGASGGVPGAAAALGPATPACGAGEPRLLPTAPELPPPPFPPPPPVLKAANGLKEKPREALALGSCCRWTLLALPPPWVLGTSPDRALATPCGWGCGCPPGLWVVGVMAPGVRACLPGMASTRGSAAAPSGVGRPGSRNEASL